MGNSDTPPARPLYFVNAWVDYALVGGVSIVTSDFHRRQADVDVVVVNGSEAVKAAPYVPCAGPSDYAGYAGTADRPAGWPAPTVVSVTTLDGTPLGPGCSDPRIQLVTLQASTPATTGPHSDVTTLSVAKRNPA